MPDFVISSASTSTEQLNNGETGIIGSSGGIYTTGSDGVNLFGTNNTVVVAGEIIADRTGIEALITGSQGAHEITVLHGGSIFGRLGGIELESQNSQASTIANHGTIVGQTALRYDTDAGVTSGNLTVTNTGIMQGDAYAMNVTDTARVFLTNTGEMHGGFSGGIRVDYAPATGGVKAQITNTGIISTAEPEGFDFAIEVNGLAGRIINSGEIIGKVEMSALDDVFNGRAGVQQYDIMMGAGDDTFAGGVLGETAFGQDGDDQMSGRAGNDRLDGGNGRDAIFGGRDDDVLTGGKGADTVSGGLGEDDILGGSGSDILSGDRGDDTISGGKGGDTITGGAGNDLMTGGQNADTFVFGVADGIDRVTDFTTGADKIDLTAIGAASLTELQGDMVFDDTASGVVMDLTVYGLSTIVYFDGVFEADLSASDFIL